MAAVFVLAWPLFVFHGSQLAYLVALAAVAALAFLLAVSSSPYALILIVVLTTLVGTEARGELGEGTAVLGSTRILDVALLFGTVGASVALVSRDGVKAVVRRRPRSLGILVLVLLLWATVVWAAGGAPWDNFLNTDVRLLGLAVATYFVARILRPEDLATVAKGMLLLAIPLALKAGLIFATDLYAIGSDDRIQATLSEVYGDKRVVLVGGDTLLILAPALWAVLRRQLRTAERRMAAAAATCAVLGLLISGTRTSVLVAAVLWVSTEVGTGLVRGWRPNRRTAAVIVVGAVMLGVGALAFGVLQRFERGDAPHTGLNFRIDEIRTAAHLPTADLAIGRGLGGTFVAKDVNGRLATTAWSHVLPVWLALKVGIGGTLLAGALLLLFIRRAAGGIRGPTPFAAVGLVTVLGLVAMSLTLGRMAQPEGAVLLGLGGAFVAAVADTRSRR